MLRISASNIRRYIGFCRPSILKMAIQCAFIRMNRQCCSRTRCAIYVLALSMAFSICQSSYSQSPSIYQNPSPLQLDNINDEVIIPFWQLIGPFQLRRDDAAPARDPNGFQQDYLTQVGYSEQTLTAQSADTLCNSLEGLCHWYPAHGAAIPLYELFRGRMPSVTYAVAQVTCAHDIDLAIEFDSSEEIAIWLNGALVRMISPGRAGGTALKYLNIEPIHLHKGDNTIVIKSDRAKEGTQWAIITSLLPLSLAKQKAIEMSDGFFIRSRIVNVGEPITINSPVLCEHEDSLVTVFNRDDVAVLTRKYHGLPATIDTAHLQPGYYRVDIDISGETIEDEFFIGNPENVYNRLVTLHANVDASNPVRALIDPIIRRYAILTSQQFSHPTQANWQKKLILVLKDGSGYISGGDTARIAQSSGFHIREYQSAIDHTIQFYLYYVPRPRSTNMPLVIEMPYAVRVERPFLESALAIGWPKALDDLSRAADKSGLSVAVIDGRGNVHDAPIGEAGTWEAINDIISHYSINRRKIYLFGTCEGGRRALMLAEHYPDAFAGVGVYGPSIGIPWVGRPLDPQDIHAGVFSQLDNLSSIPVHILEGEFDYDPPREILYDFIDDLKKISPSSELTVVKDGMHGTSDAERILFPWLVQFELSGANSHLSSDLKQAISKVTAVQIGRD